MSLSHFNTSIPSNSSRRHQTQPHSIVTIVVIVIALIIGHRFRLLTIQAVVRLRLGVADDEAALELIIRIDHAQVELALGQNTSDHVMISRSDTFASILVDRAARPKNLELRTSSVVKGGPTLAEEWKVSDIEPTKLGARRQDLGQGIVESTVGGTIHLAVINRNAT